MLGDRPQVHSRFVGSTWQRGRSSRLGSARFQVLLSAPVVPTLTCAVAGARMLSYLVLGPLASRTAMKSSRISCHATSGEIRAGGTRCRRAVVCGRLRRTAIACRAIPPPGTKEPYAAADRAGSRSLLEARRSSARGLPGPGPLPGHRRARHARDPRGSCSAASGKKARRQSASHRTGRQPGLATQSTGCPGREVDVLALEDALARLAKLDPCQARMIELRFFGGLNVAEVAKVMGMSKRSVEREWTMVRAWLRRELGGSDVS